MVNDLESIPRGGRTRSPEADPGRRPEPAPGRFAAAGMPVVLGIPDAAAGRHRRSLSPFRAARQLPLDRIARGRLLWWSAVGIGCLLMAHRMRPEGTGLFSGPTDLLGWIAVVCGFIGIWLVPGLWLSALVMRTGAGLAAWLGTRVGVALAWYVLLGPVIHDFGRGALITTVGLLVATSAATAAVCFGVTLGFSRWPGRVWLRGVIAAVLGGAVAQGVIWLSMRTWTYDMNYSEIRRLDWLIVSVCALLATVGTLSRPKLPSMWSPQVLCATVVTLAVVATTLGVLETTEPRWSPSQQMPSAFSAEQTTAPPGSDMAFALTGIGPDGPARIEQARFAAYDTIGRQVSIEARLVPADDTTDRATLLVTLERSSQQVLCEPHGVGSLLEPGRAILNPLMRPPVKLTLRDLTSGMRVQGVVYREWCSE